MQPCHPNHRQTTIPKPVRLRDGCSLQSLIRSARLMMILLSVPLLLQSQQVRSFAEIDSLSYRAYLNSDWKEVINLAKEGFRDGYDYYYLRMRAGEAELNRKNPVGAAEQFRKALVFNDKDPIALELLYSSLLFSGDLAESRLLAANYSKEFREKLGIPARRLITSAFFEPGYMSNPKSDQFSVIPDGAELAHIYGVPNYWYFSAGINLEAGKRFSATLSTNILSFAATQQILIRNLPPIVFDVPFDQRAVYLGGNYYLGKGFHLSLAGQMMSSTIPLYQWVDSNTGGQYELGATSYRDLALNFSVYKQFHYVTIGLGADVNRLKNLWYKQVQTELTLYPAGNINTYLKVGGTWLPDSLKPSGRVVAHAIAGRKLFRTIWMEGEYYLGDIRNFSEHNAYVVFNNLDVIRKRMGFTILAYQVLPHLDLSLRYQYTLRSASWQIYKNSKYIGDLSKDYPVNSFIGGLTWRF